jgi:hypothetical protein
MKPLMHSRIGPRLQCSMEKVSNGEQISLSIGVTSNHDSNWEDQQQTCCRYLVKQSHCQKEITVFHAEDAESHEFPAVSSKRGNKFFLDWQGIMDPEIILKGTTINKEMKKVLTCSWKAVCLRHH